MPLAVHTAHYGDPVRAFVETLVFEAGFAHLEPEMRADIITALMVEAHKRIGLDLMNAIDHDSLAYFRTLKDREADDEEVAAFFRVRVPDLDDRVKGSLSAFGVECLKIARDLGTIRAVRV